MDHPRDWEIALAAGPDEPPRCAFADRHYYRLDLRWQEVHGSPQPGAAAGEAPPEPQGRAPRRLAAGRSARPGGAGCCEKARAAASPTRPRCSATGGCWRRRRCFGPGSATRSWRRPSWNHVAVDAAAAGPPVAGHGDQPGAGRGVQAPQQRQPRRPGAVAVRRPRRARPRRSPSSAWPCPTAGSSEPLEDWLTEQLPPRHAVVARGATTFNGHAAAAGCSAGARAAWRRRSARLRPIRLDVAWLCQAENRLYHLTFARLSRTEDTGAAGRA